MKTVAVSSTFEITIPIAMREALRLQPGQQVQLVQYENRIELIPLRPTRAARGFLKGLDTTVEREPDRT